ncbi:MAG: twin-arginine translocase TatA/TatE family subunit [Thaumarchaeota archaeon]|nr:twin-arginine translocase TatA/TatE family subunit [Nitrososphaerota archaeon]
MGQEWLFIILIVVIFIFGAKKIPELAKTLGKAKGEYEKGKIEGEKELHDFKDKK